MKIIDFNKDENMVMHGMNNYIQVLQILEKNNEKYGDIEKIYFILSLGHSLIYRGLKFLASKEDIETMDYNFGLIKDAIDNDLNRVRALNGAI